MTNQDRGPETSIANGSRSVFVRYSRRNLGSVSTVVARYALACPSLRGMSEVLDTLSCRLQSVQEWLVPGSGRERDLSGMDPVLFLSNPAQLQSLEVG